MTIKAVKTAILQMQKNGLLTIEENKLNEATIILAGAAGNWNPSEDAEELLIAEVRNYDFPTEVFLLEACVECGENITAHDQPDRKCPEFIYLDHLDITYRFSNMKIQAPGEQTLTGVEILLAAGGPSIRATFTSAGAATLRGRWYGSTHSIEARADPRAIVQYHRKDLRNYGIPA